jgi:hypothetical protein
VRPAHGRVTALDRDNLEGRVGIVTQRLVDNLGSMYMGSTPSKRTEAHDAFHDIVGFFI